MFYVGEEYCDESCAPTGFDLESNTIICDCEYQGTGDADEDKNQLQELLEDNEALSMVNEMINNSNLKYFKCWNQFVRKTFRSGITISLISIVVFLSFGGMYGFISYPKIITTMYTYLVGAGKLSDLNKIDLEKQKEKL